ncbi:MAG: UDP-glucose--hexose-1-phosphate uridylyltransferase [Firmicutes bacterium]|nr:UDP-glucose--hexose-1-phosphate uridylyltransferase [Bacillota bacterium]
MTDAAISKLLLYAEEKGLIEPSERIWAANAVIDALGLDSYTPADLQTRAVEGGLGQRAVEGGLGQRAVEGDGPYRLAAILSELLNGKADDLLDTAIMGRLTPRPAQVIEKFDALCARDPKAATDWYYAFSQDTNYIRRDRIAKDIRWRTATAYGELDITVNLSKPEKDPRVIAAARTVSACGYPLCQLCAESEGYAGRIDYPARGNHRIIPITLGGARWYLQYSPYVYYNEHCIALNAEHIPMKIDRGCFARLLEFVFLFPHYFMGSNADLPIVGGSILSHDHFQGGRYDFPMALAPVEKAVSFRGFEGVEAGVVRWPMSVLRLRSAERGALVDLADKILGCWRAYTDESVYIFAETEGEPHNTITAIARFRDGAFELDLVLRNNITTAEHPLGVFHPHAELHHIKKENIGLIEVMGLAVLPPRLRDQYDLESAEAREEIGQVFAKVLEHCGVFKRDAQGQSAFLKFMESVNAYDN